MQTPTERLHPIRGSDPVLQAIRGGALLCGAGSWEPSGVEETAFVLARSAATNKRPLALAVPRGHHQLATGLAAYLGFARANDLLPFRGNVALATSDLDIRSRLGRLSSGRNPFKAPEVRRLVAGVLRADGRPTTQARPLDGTTGSRGISHDDRFLLVHRPSFQPSVPENVISVSVVDCLTSADRTWAALRLWADAAHRAQIFVGELGDRGFEDFCSTFDVPVWRFDWGLLGREPKEGRGGFSLGALVRRAHEPRPTLRYRVCDDGEVDDHLREIDHRLAQMLRKAQGDPLPRPVMAARRLSWFLGRLAAPLDTYITAALHEYGALQPHAELAHVTGAYKSLFVGRWQGLWEGDWASLAGHVRRLYEYVARESPKYLDLHTMVEEYRDQGIKLSIRCSTRAEARALGPALVENGALTLEELTSERAPVEILWFGRQTPPLPHGPAGKRRVTVVTEPPPPFRASLYCSAEEGSIEALLYPSQAHWFPLNARRAAQSCVGGLSNVEVVQTCFPAELHAEDKVVDFPVEALAAVGFTGRKPVEAGGPPSDAVSRMMDFFAEIAAMSDGEMRDPSEAVSSVADPVAAARMVPEAVLLRTRERTSVALLAGTKVDQLVSGKLRTVLVEELRPGQQVALVDGNQRGTILLELMEAWDQTFGPARVFYDLYVQAFHTAYENVGGTDAALAQKLAVHASTVRAWRRGDNLAPQQDIALRGVLDLSENPAAISHFKQIRHYLATVRGTHRLIGRVLNDAVAETLVTENGPAQQELEGLTRLDLSSFFSSLQVFTVEGITTALDVPASRLGRFLALDDPIVTKADT